MKRWTLRRSGLGLALLWALAGVWAQPVTVSPCEELPVEVQTRHPEVVALVCDGAREAAGFLDGLNLAAPQTPILIELVRHLPPDVRRDAVGVYAIRSPRLLVLELPVFLARGTWMGVATSRTLYRSVVAHEVAHALVAAHLGARALASAGHEYLAYVTMFATMDGPTRDAVLAAVPGEGFTQDTEINDLRYALDPMRFGVEAYRHWLRQPDGERFLRRVIDGQVVPDLLLTRRPEPTRP